MRASSRLLTLMSVTRIYCGTDDGGTVIMTDSWTCRDITNMSNLRDGRAYRPSVERLARHRGESRFAGGSCLGRYAGSTGEVFRVDAELVQGVAQLLASFFSLFFDSLRFEFVLLKGRVRRHGFRAVLEHHMPTIKADEHLASIAARTVPPSP